MRVTRALNPFQTFDKLLRTPDNSVPAEQAHRLRTSARRIEVITSQIDLTGKEVSVLETIKDLRRRAGKLRDLDVQLTLLVELNGAAKSVGHQLREFLLEKRLRTESKLNGRIRKVAKKKFRARLLAMAEHTDPGAERPDLLDEVNVQLHGPIAFHLHDPKLRLNSELLHGMRTDLKKLRYLAEAAGPIPEAVALVARLKKVQDAIGRWHDYTELLSTASHRLHGPATVPFLAQLRSWTASAHAAALDECTRLATEYPAPKKSPRAVRAVKTPDTEQEEQPIVKQA